MTQRLHSANERRDIFVLLQCDPLSFTYRSTGDLVVRDAPLRDCMGRLRRLKPRALLLFLLEVSLLLLRCFFFLLVEEEEAVREERLPIELRRRLLEPSES